MTSTVQPWLSNIPMMQQAVVLQALRGPDGLEKYNAAKFIVRWLRRCLVISAIDHHIFTDPAEPGGGSFTGPSVSLDPSKPDMTWEDAMEYHVTEYMQKLDAMPFHYHMHLMHAIQILGYHHPDQRIRVWWCKLYVRFVHDMHLNPETADQLNHRLSDNLDNWMSRSDPATLM